MRALAAIALLSSLPDLAEPCVGVDYEFRKSSKFKFPPPRTHPYGVATMQKPRLLFWFTPRRAITACAALVFIQICYLLLRDGQMLQTYVEDSPSSIKHELVSLTNNYKKKESNKSAAGAKSTVGVVLASIRSDDLTWLRDYCHETGSTPFVYSGDQNPEPGLLIPANLRGREAPAYLSYVVDFYDNLPDYSIFVHAHPEQWHNDLFGPFTHDTLRNIRFQSVDALGYVNLRCEHDPGCPTGVNPLNPTKIDIEGKDIRAYFADAYQEIFNVPRSEVPKEIGNVCCGQFVVSRERILQRPKEDYQRILNWAGTTKQTDSFGVGWVMEKLWHIVFGMDAIYCPRYEQCRCDVYGWCGPLPSGETLTPATKNEL